MTKVIGDYTAAVTIDGSTNYLLIQPGGITTAYNKINRNTLLGVSGQPADISTAQTFQNKVLDNTNTVTVKDTLFKLQDNSDTTKQAQFELSSITTASTRTYTLPDATTTLVGTGTTQTLTNKTLTSPTITGGTYDNGTITVDSIGGHTSANVVTVAGLQINNGALNTNNSVVTANITDAAVTPAKLIAGTGTGWSLQSYTPTFTNVTVGNGTLTAAYIQMGKVVFVRMQLVFGTTSSVSGGCIFTLPVTSVASYRTDSQLGNATFNGAAFCPCTVLWNTSTTVQIYGLKTDATYATNIATTAAIPTALSAGSAITAEFFYEAA